jgi:hypothetical protein
MADENREKTRSAQKVEEQESQEKERSSYADEIEESLQQGYFGHGTEGKDRDAYTLRTGPGSPPHLDREER